MSWPWKRIPLCFGGGEGKERLSAAVFLETKRNVASSIYLDSHDDEVYMLLFVARIPVSHSCSAILTVSSYVQKFWGDFELPSWILCFACHAAYRFGLWTDYLTSSQSHIWTVLSLVSSCYMNRIPKLTLIYPLSSSTRELHEAKAASVKEKSVLYRH